MCESLSHVRLIAIPWTIARQASLSMEFSRQEYWSGLPFPCPGDLPDPGIKHRTLELWADSLSSEPLGKPKQPKPKNIDDHTTSCSTYGNLLLRLFQLLPLGTLSGWLLWYFVVYPHLFVFEHFLLNTTGCCMVTLCFPYPRPRISHCSKEP